MPIHFEIVEDGHIIYARVSDPWTLQDYQANVKADLDHRNSVPFPVHSLLNLTQVNRYIPSDVFTVRRSPTFTHARPGKIALVGSNAIIKVFAESIMRLARVDPARFFNTEAEAWAYLREVIQSERPEPQTNQAQK